MARIITYNVNGIRAAMGKGLIDWMQQAKPDILCVQEIKASPDQVGVFEFEELGYEHFWYPAQKKGYSGVAIFSRSEEHTSELQSHHDIVCRLLLEKKKK